jgi:hypothetical protein
MAKAKRERRTSIRTMSADVSALEALESLERAEQSSGPPGPSSDETPAGEVAPPSSGHDDEGAR